MSLSAGTLGVLGMVNTRLGDAGSFLNTGAPPAGREEFYNFAAPTAAASQPQTSLFPTAALGQVLPQTGMATAQPFATAMPNTATAAPLAPNTLVPTTGLATQPAGTGLLPAQNSVATSITGMPMTGNVDMDLNNVTMAINQLLTLMTMQKKARPKASFAKYAKVEPLEKQVKVAKPDFTPLGSNGSGE